MPSSPAPRTPSSLSSRQTWLPRETGWNRPKSTVMLLLASGAGSASVLPPPSASGSLAAASESGALRTVAPLALPLSSLSAGLASASGAGSQPPPVPRLDT
jgi:hypothetical protein